MDCIFCKIIAREVPSKIVFENDHLVIFPDIRPLAPVHYLVVPKHHVPSIAHLEEEHRDLIAELIYAAKDHAKKEGLAGYKLVFNVGRAGGQDVDHLHVHLLGGWPGKAPATLDLMR